MKTKINIVAIQSNVSKDFDTSINNLLKKIDEIKYRKNSIVILHELSFYRYIAITKTKKYQGFEAECGQIEINIVPKLFLLLFPSSHPSKELPIHLPLTQISAQ